MDEGFKRGEGFSHGGLSVAQGRVQVFAGKVSLYLWRMGMKWGMKEILGTGGAMKEVSFSKGLGTSGLKFSSLGNGRGERKKSGNEGCEFLQPL